MTDPSWTERRSAERIFVDGICLPDASQGSPGCGDYTDQLDVNIQRCPDCARAFRKAKP